MEATEVKNSTEADKEYEEQLTTDDKAKIADELAAIETQIERTEAEKKETVDAYKEQLSELEDRRKDRLDVLRRGSITRKVRAVFRVDEVTNEVVWTEKATGKEIERRPMTAQETQMTLDELLRRNQAAARKAEQSDDDREEEAIQDVIREETNPRTKLSAVDGARGDSNDEALDEFREFGDGPEFEEDVYPEHEGNA